MTRTTNREARRVLLDLARDKCRMAGIAEGQGNIPAYRAFCWQAARLYREAGDEAMARALEREMEAMIDG
jgi:hypothetical protein